MNTKGASTVRKYSHLSIVNKDTSSADEPEDPAVVPNKDGERFWLLAKFGETNTPFKHRSLEWWTQKMHEEDPQHAAADPRKEYIIDMYARANFRLDQLSYEPKRATHKRPTPAQDYGCW